MNYHNLARCLSYMAEHQVNFIQTIFLPPLLFPLLPSPLSNLTNPFPKSQVMKDFH